VLLVALSGTTVSPQDRSCLNRTLSLVAADRDGNLITDLHPSDFEATIHHEPVQILSITPDTRPHRIVIVLDLSGSMGTQERVVFIPALLLARTRIPNSSMALLAFDEKIIAQADFSDGQPAIVEKLIKLRQESPAQRRTALFDTVVAALRLLPSPSSADVLYVISDGADNVSHTRFEQLRSQVTASGVRLFASLMQGQRHPNRSLTPEEENGPWDLGQLANLSGGAVDTPLARGLPTKPKENEAFLEGMREFYRTMVQNDQMQIQLPNAFYKTTAWELKLSKSANISPKNVSLFYRKSLEPCSK